MGEGKTVEHWDAWTATMQAKHGNGNGHGKSLAIEAQRLLPTPAARDWKDHRVEVAGHRPDDESTLNRAIAHNLLPTPRTSDTNGAGAHGQGGPDLRTVVGDEQTRWGDYAAAIARWESVLGRHAPDPTEPGPKGSPRLSPLFVEFLMGLPEGHVTGAGLTRNEALKALGNGVVPQQAAAATRWWLAQVADMGRAVAS